MATSHGTHWTEPTGDAKAGFGKWQRPPTPYDRFMEEEEIPVHRAIGVHRVQDLPLKPWKRTGGSGTYIQLYGTEGLWGMYVVEVPAAGALNVERHLYEETFLVVEGRGSTEVWQDKDPSKKSAFEWSAGSLFSVPLNSWHRIINSTSSPALLLAGTTAPNAMNLYMNRDFVFNTPYDFTDRYDAAADFYRPAEDLAPDPVRGLAMLRTNIMPDIINCELPLDNRRSPGYRRVEPHMASNKFYLWIGQHETGRYSKAHAHGSAAGADLPQGEGVHLYLARGVGDASVGDREGGKGDVAGLRAGGHGERRAHERRLVPPALRRQLPTPEVDGLVRPARARPRGRPSRRGSHRQGGHRPA